MKKKNRIDNRVCNPKKPETAEAKATQCLQHMLNGGVINRITLDKIGISAKNDSAHTMISKLRNDELIPVISHRTDDKTCDYYMTPEEIKRYKDPLLREQQREEMKLHVDEKRVHKILKSFSKFLQRLRDFPKLWQHVESSEIALEQIPKDINALNDSKKK